MYVAFISFHSSILTYIHPSIIHPYIPQYIHPYIHPSYSISCFSSRRLCCFSLKLCLSYLLIRILSPLSLLFVHLFSIPLRWCSITPMSHIPHPLSHDYLLLRPSSPPDEWANAHGRLHIVQPMLSMCLAWLAAITPPQRYRWRVFNLIVGQA